MGCTEVYWGVRGCTRLYGSLTWCAPSWLCPQSCRTRCSQSTPPPWCCLWTSRSPCRSSLPCLKRIQNSFREQGIGLIQNFSLWHPTPLWPTWVKKKMYWGHAISRVSPASLELGQHCQPSQVGGHRDWNEIIFLPTKKWLEWLNGTSIQHSLLPTWLSYQIFANILPKLSMIFRKPSRVSIIKSKLLVEIRKFFVVEFYLFM